MQEERLQVLRKIYAKTPTREWRNLASKGEITWDECLFLYAQKAKQDAQKKDDPIEQTAKSFGGEVIEQ